VSLTRARTAETISRRLQAYPDVDDMDPDILRDGRMSAVPPLNKLLRNLRWGRACAPW